MVTLWTLFYIKFTHIGTPLLHYIVHAGEATNLLLDGDKV